MTRVRRAQADWRPVAAAVGLFVVAAVLARGGLATSAHPGDVGHYHTFATRLRDGLFPYGSGFYLEYPPFALPALMLPDLVSSAHYLAVFKAAMALCSVATIVVVGWTLDLEGRPGRTKLLLLVPVALGPLLLGSTYLNRYDPYAALLTSAALLLLAGGRTRSGAVMLALSLAAKTYAAAILPVAAIWVWRTRGRRELLRSTAAFAVTTAVVYAPFVLRAFGGLGNSYWTQARRALQIESTGASGLLVADKLGLYTVHWFRGMSVDLAGGGAHAIATITSLVEVAAILGIAWLYLRTRATDAQSFLLAATASVLAFVTFNKVFSPQYMTWVIPLVVLAPLRLATRASILLVAALIATNVEITWGDWGLRNGDWTVWVLAFRNLTVLALFVLFTRELARRRA